MRLLAIRVGPDGPAVAVLGGSGAAVERARPGARAEALAPLVAEALAVAGLGFADLEALAVLTGPGSFTATRAAVASARALALATGLPVHALSALELAAETFAAETRPAEKDAQPFLVLAPAGRGALAVQPFGPDAEPAGPVELLAPEAACEAAARAGGPVALVDLEDGAGPPAVRLRADALALARAAVARAVRGRAPLPGPAVRPLYLRPPDARLEAGRALVAAG